MSEAVPADAAAAAEKKRPLLRRVPTSVIVTVLGIALTAWLLPAFTRQWEDRQKATDLKAGVLDEIASATAKAFAGADSLAHGDGIIHPRELSPQGRAAAREWAVAWFRVDARLRTYLDPHVEAMWADYDTAIRNFLLISEVHGQAKKGMTTDAAAYLDAIYLSKIRKAATCSKGAQLPKPIQLIGLMDHLVALRYTLLRCDSRISDAVLAGHPRGYSTTAHDLIRDLTP